MLPSQLHPVAYSTIGMGGQEVDKMRFFLNVEFFIGTLRLPLLLVPYVHHAAPSQTSRPHDSS
jgi:hypothetical protein